MHTVSIQEAQARLPDLVKEAGSGEEIVITENEKPVATLGAPPAQNGGPPSKRWRGFGLLKGEIEMMSDFDEPLDDFRGYME